MRSFVVKVLIRNSSRDLVQTRYYNAAGENGSEAIAVAREQMKRENEPRPGLRASYHAKPRPAGVVNPWGD